MELNSLSDYRSALRLAQEWVGTVLAHENPAEFEGLARSLASDLKKRALCDAGIYAEREKINCDLRRSVRSAVAASFRTTHVNA